MNYTYADYQASANFLKSKISTTPKIAIVLGTCLGGFADCIENPITVDYKDIPNFLLSTVESHAGKLIFGTIGDKSVVCMSGRFHSYEGYDYEQLVIPVRVLKLLGVETLILTNAAGAVNPSYHPGDVMVLSDHLKLTGHSPLRGKNIDEFGPRFFDVTRMYTPALRQIALDCSQRSPLTVHQGVYMFFTGPQFETPAEIRAAALLGADAVGMSTVTEALTAAHCGLPVLAMSVITNMAAGIVPNTAVTTDEVDTVANTISTDFGAFVQDILATL